MKLIQKKCLFILLPFIFCSCMTNKINNNPDAIPDSYGQTTEEKEATITKQASSMDTSAIPTKGRWDDLLSYGNSKYMLKIDESTIFTTTITSNIKQQVADITINLKDNHAGFGSTYMAAYYYMFMSEETRTYLEKAVNSYLKDFSEKRLDKKNMNTASAYGKINVEVQWGSLQSSTPNSGSGKASLGYCFHDKSPYFTITMYPVKNDKADYDESAVAESMTLKYYMTKAQATKLSELLSKENINKYLIRYYNLYEQGSSDDYSNE